MNMILEKYLENPCKQASLPFWKIKNLVLPSNISVFHQNEFNADNYENVERYFRLIHNLKVIENSSSTTKNIEESDFDNLIGMINSCYRDQNIFIKQEDLREYMNRRVYNKELWICIYINNVMIASGIAEYDLEAKEGILEWIQVIPEFQRHGYGSIIVNNLLKRLKTLKANFVTVSGNLDNIHSPIDLYRKCGFTGNDIWYICRD